MKKRLTGNVIKWIGVFFMILGFAFYAGSFLAYVQGVITQIGMLAIFGTLCVAAGIFLFILGLKKTKKNQ